jgi:hypothetical protein
MTPIDFWAKGSNIKVTLKGKKLMGKKGFRSILKNA